mgnify:CR=1 FL=1
MNQNYNNEIQYMPLNNIEYLSTLYRNELDLKDYEIESLKNELNETNNKLENTIAQKELLLLESQNIKDIYSAYNNYIFTEKEKNEKEQINKYDKINIKKNNEINNEIKNNLLLRAINFYNKINNCLIGDNKGIININQYSQENLNNNVDRLYELEYKLQSIRKNIFKKK